ncbi:MAG: hypothetical protein ACRD0Q_07210, partial [Acidimicrobiales bacterium]
MITALGPSAFGIQARSAADADPSILDGGWNRLALRIDELLHRAARDAAIAAASGRWRTGRPDPDRYLPGDVVALRSFSVAADLTQVKAYQAYLEASMRRGQVADLESQIAAVNRTVLTVADIGTLFDAVPHFIEADAAVGILSSRPPEAQSLADLRLPYPRIAVYFGRCLELGPELHDWPRDWDIQTDLRGAPTGTRTAVGDLRALGGGIEGVVLSEMPGGGLCDEVLWLVSANPDPTRDGPSRFDRYRATVWGRLSSARLAHVAHNLAATVSWAEWREPSRTLSLPGDAGSTAWRKAVRRGEFRRHEPRGATAGVRVLDVVRTPVADRVVSRSPGTRTAHSPITHLRRAHWRQQRVGSGLTERRLVRVPATVVNPGGGPLGSVVYRVPAPDGRDTPSPSTPDDPELDLRSVDLPEPPGRAEQTAEASIESAPAPT